MSGATSVEPAPVIDPFWVDAKALALSPVAIVATTAANVRPSNLVRFK
jgi:hypothetical protein